MHNKSIAFSFVALILALCLVFASCQDSDAGDLNETPEEEGSETPENEETEGEGNGEEPEETPTPMPEQSPTPEPTPTPTPEPEPTPEPTPEPSPEPNPEPMPEPEPMPTYQVKFDIGYDALENLIETTGKINQPEAPIRIGYEFLGWFSGDTLWDFETHVSSDLVLTAKWRLIEYSINYVLNGGVNNPQNPSVFTVETESLTLLEPSNQALIFGGWYLDEGFTLPFEFSANPLDLTVYARFVYPSEAFVFEEIGGEYYVKSAPISEDIVVIPDTYLDCKVVGILDNAFSGNALKTLILPSGIKYIEKDAFSQCTSLQFIECGDVKYLGTLDNPYFALISAKDGVESIEINDETVIIADSALAIYSLATVSGGESVKYVGDSAFAYARELSCVEIFDTVVEIGENAFSRCVSLENISFGDQLTEIGEAAFSYCTGLAYLKLPSGIEEIKENAFSSCNSLKTIILDKSLKTIGKNAFYGLPDTAKIYYKGSLEEWRLIELNSNFEMNSDFIYCDYIE